MIRAGIIAAAVTYFLAVHQTMLGGRMVLWGVSPDLLLVWTACLGLRCGPAAGAVIGFASGTLQGSLAQGGIGAYGISKTVSGALAGLLAGKLSRENRLVPAMCAAALTVVNELVVLLVSRGGAPSHLLRFIGLRALYHAALAAPVYPLVSWAWHALLRPRAAVS